MDYQDIKSVLGGLLEDLAAIEQVTRWQKQIDTKYNELGEQEKESDREQVRKYVSVIASALGEQIDHH